MNRRESLALLVVAAAGQSLPALALARASDQSVAIYDGRYSEACEFAADAAMALDCRVDAALLWYASGLAAARHVHMVSGMTTAADALVIADCASRSGMRFARIPHATTASPLVCWALTRPVAIHHPA